MLHGQHEQDQVYCCGMQTYPKFVCRRRRQKKSFIVRDKRNYSCKLNRRRPYFLSDASVLFALTLALSLSLSLSISNCQTCDRSDALDLQEVRVDIFDMFF
jgi:hypothetical protein